MYLLSFGEVFAQQFGGVRVEFPASGSPGSQLLYAPGLVRMLALSRPCFPFLPSLFPTISPAVGYQVWAQRRGH
jgi:hypothetical protein